jgi:hypothetical protein
MLDLWYRALHAKIGVEVSCRDPDAVRSRLYKVRRDCQDADLAQISISLSPFDADKLWLMKRKDAK